ncbi:hypothetical protein MUN84_19690 [Hymenobacter sp. 5516J-16]|uniref:hypothetical protein n=1 Tax=Hymenobacter sp. 5516J-16 TaxID=2932253 RepID=UPI001FD0BD32|nr:hypothetical protein [Hymenobacter sp. 5516J-16]UOQ76715.1 hypothetical protein MUN84_19690 [Hymenobacter sp. 5516J-16]
MNLSLKEIWSVLLLVICSCAQEQRGLKKEEQTFYPYTLDLITILIPASWKQIDLDPGSGDTEEPYVFMNPAQQSDSLLGDAFMVVIKKQKDKPNLKRLQQQFAESMEVAGESQIRVISSQDSVFAGRKFVLIDYNMRYLSYNLNQVGTFACYYKDGALITITGVARSKSSEEDSKKRALFREVIYSVKWIKDYPLNSKR